MPKIQSIFLLTLRATASNIIHWRWHSTSIIQRQLSPLFFLLLVYFRWGEIFPLFFSPHSYYSLYSSLPYSYPTDGTQLFFFLPLVVYLMRGKFSLIYYPSLIYRVYTRFSIHILSVICMVPTVPIRKMILPEPCIQVSVRRSSFRPSFVAPLDVVRFARPFAPSGGG